MPQASTQPLFDARPERDQEATSASVSRLNARWRSIQAQRVLRMALVEEFPGRIAVSSSFGAESAVLLVT